MSYIGRGMLVIFGSLCHSRQHGDPVVQPKHSTKFYVYDKGYSAYGGNPCDDKWI